MPRRFLLWGAILGLGGAAALVGACGARSGLDLPTSQSEGGGGSGGSPERDAGRDAQKDAPKDAPPDVPKDVQHDVPVPFDCVEAGITYVYLMTAENVLLRFYPPNGTAETVGVIQCPVTDPQGMATPFSMAVDRKGVAHVVFDDGELFRVSTKDASCEATAFQPGQHGFTTFGMGFSSNASDEGETLYVSDIDRGLPSKGLATIDLDTFELTPIGEFTNGYDNAMELTGTGDAKLYGYMLGDSSGGNVLEINKQNAHILHSKKLGVGTGQSALAFASWGGAFYIFTSGGQTTNVHQFIPGDTLNQYATIQGTVVGAGVSTCAPSQ